MRNSIMRHVKFAVRFGVEIAAPRLFIVGSRRERWRFLIARIKHFESKAKTKEDYKSV